MGCRRRAARCWGAPRTSTPPSARGSPPRSAPPISNSTRSTRHRRAAVREVGPNLQEIRGERDGLDSQIEELQRDRAGVRDDVADRELAAAPRWLHDTLGDPPAAGRGRQEWDQAARVLARYRVDQDLDDDVPGVGPEPDDPDKRRGWQRVSADLTRAQRRLGREQTLDRGRGRGLERD